MNKTRFLKKIVISSWIIGNSALILCALGNYLNSLDTSTIAVALGTFNSIELGLSALVKRGENNEPA